MFLRKFLSWGLVFFISKFNFQSQTDRFLLNRQNRSGLILLVFMKTDQFLTKLYSIAGRDIYIYMMRGEIERDRFANKNPTHCYFW
jgi:hypothetical protein